MKKFNINRSVRFKPTERGKEILKEYSGDPKPHIVVDAYYENGYMSMQMWRFMECFGKHTHHGTPPFECDLLINEEDLV